MRNFNERGYTLAAVLTMIAVMSILMALSVPLWTWVKKRDNEEELIFRGREYVEAIARYHARFHTYPPDLETLFKQKYIRKLYKDPMTESGKWKVLRPDSLLQTGAAGQILQPGAGSPLTSGQEEDQEQAPGLSPQSKESNQEKEGDDQTNATTGEEPESEVIGPVAGVASRNREKSIKLYNGQQYYNKWVFVFLVPQQEQQQQPPPGKSPKGEQKQNKKDQQKKQPVEPPSEQN